MKTVGKMGGSRGQTDRQTDRQRQRGCMGQLACAKSSALCPTERWSKARLVSASGKQREEEDQTRVNDVNQLAVSIAVSASARPHWSVEHYFCCLTHCLVSSCY